ncbi:MAG: histidine phosphatase family protein [Armatimonadota bacterium]|nr:histidine phosphatase family protein [Armatimonadota bacterium]MDW8155669.1 histidine phosphatase family protein [Armatimonadota bacterium]
MTRVYLVRHGQTTWNAERRYQGRKDAPLTELGRSQMRRLAAALASEPVRAVYTSPLGRCRWGAERIAAQHGLEPIVEPDLVELDHGILDGLRVDEMEDHVGQLVRRWWEDPAAVHLPGGETLEQARSRAYGAFRRIVDRHPDQTVVVVAHGGVNKLILLTLLQAPLASYFRIQQHNGAVNLVEVPPHGSPRIVAINDTCYLRLPSQDPAVVGQE